MDGRDKPGHDDGESFAIAESVYGHDLSPVMPGYMPRIQVFATARLSKTWMAGTSPAMTLQGTAFLHVMPGFMPGIHVFNSAAPREIARNSLPHPNG